MLEEKARMSGEVIASGGEGWITELDNDQLLDLFSLGLCKGYRELFVQNFRLDAYPSRTVSAGAKRSSSIIG